MKIFTAPDKVLSQEAKSIDKIDAEVLELVDKMWSTLGQAGGVGLAAPQIGRSIRLAIVGFEPTPEQKEKNPKIQSVPRKVLINPKIVWSSKDMNTDREGCLSLPKVEVDVARHKKIHVVHLDKKGKKQKTKARGYSARVIQHELDHLNGKLITDYK